jgi:hypothetical protein
VNKSHANVVYSVQEALKPLRGYVNTCVVAAMQVAWRRQKELHSSFVVFYFVFVFDCLLM